MIFMKIRKLKSPKIQNEKKDEKAENNEKSG
jgi:hypothetical protein